MSSRHSFFKTKSIERLREEVAAGGGLRRTLTALDLMMLGVGVVVGAGIFVVTGRAAAINAGPAVIISFVIAGFAAALAGLCYAEMASVMPASGGTYTYTSATLGELVAFIIGWDLILEYLLGAAMVSVSWSGYVQAFLQNTFNISLPKAFSGAPFAYNETTEHFGWTGSCFNLPACLFVGLVSCVLVRGVRESSRLNTIVVILKLIAIGLFVSFGLGSINPDNWTPFLPANTGQFGAFGVSGVVQGASLVFFAYIGFDAISTAAQEARDPTRDLPRGILGSLAICVTLYVVVTLVLTGLVPYTELDVPHPIAVGIDVIGHKWLTSVVELGAIAGLSSGVIVMLMGQPRIFLAMAKDGLFPKVAAKIHPKYKTPHVTTLANGVACAMASALLPVDVLGELVSVSTLLAFALVSISVTVLRRRKPTLPRTFRVPGGDYLVPCLSAAISFGLILSMPNRTLGGVGLWMVLGFGFYFAYARRHSLFGQDA